jgi:hypothetical protein
VDEPTLSPKDAGAPPLSELQGLLIDYVPEAR